MRISLLALSLLLIGCKTNIKKDPNISYDKSDFVEGFAIILTSEGRGLMDMDGNTIFTGDFDKITTVHEGLFVTQKGNEFKIYRIEEN